LISLTIAASKLLNFVGDVATGVVDKSNGGITVTPADKLALLARRGGGNRTALGTTTVLTAVFGGCAVTLIPKPVRRTLMPGRIPRTARSALLEILGAFNKKHSTDKR